MSQNQITIDGAIAAINRHPSNDQLVRISISKADQLISTSDLEAEQAEWLILRTAYIVGEIRGRNVKSYLEELAARITLD